MTDREKVIKGLECLAQKQEPMANPCNGCGYIDKPNFAICVKDVASDALELLKEHENLLGICQTSDGIAFISKGTAQEGEKRGITLGKKLMHEWLYKELLYKDLLTDEIRSVFEQAKSI